MSLKSNLQQLIKDRNGEVFTLNELEAYCHKYPAKLSQAERRLRECPDIGKEFKKGAIVGYYWKSSDLDAPRASQIHTLDDCPSWNAFGVRCPDCREKELAFLTKEEMKTLF
jgi:hypothetical protein